LQVRYNFFVDNPDENQCTVFEEAQFHRHDAARGRVVHRELEGQAKRLHKDNRPQRCARRDGRPPRRQARRCANDQHRHHEQGHRLRPRIEPGQHAATREIAMSP
jgi:hypothetical protein